MNNLLNGIGFIVLGVAIFFVGILFERFYAKRMKKESMKLSR